jgi:pyruvate/2-oxoglutarate dehydrogenase complex dihydrolipoamide acyltransferase (E2) component
MRHTVKMPNVGETSATVVILEWLIEPGSTVTASQPVVRVETDKVDVEVPVPIGGTVVDLLVDPDEEIPVGAPIMVVESP